MEAGPALTRTLRRNFEFTFGRIEARARMPAKNSTWSAVGHRARHRSGNVAASVKWTSWKISVGGPSRIRDAQCPGHSATPGSAERTFMVTTSGTTFTSCPSSRDHAV